MSLPTTETRKAVPRRGTARFAPMVTLLAAFGCGDDPPTQPAGTAGPACSVRAGLQSFPAGLALPIAGEFGTEWVVTNLLDHGNGRDFRGERQTYPTHRGTDFHVPNFRWMDRGVPVLAVDKGRVLSAEQTNFDRKTNPDLDQRAGNKIVLEHNWGVSHYSHLRQESVPTAEVGQCFERGDTIGFVGSSGYSWEPHLHFQLRGGPLLGPRTGWLDPFQEGYWSNPPDLAPPLRIMDALAVRGSIPDADFMKDPPDNVTELTVGDSLGLGIYTSGGLEGENLAIDVVRGSDTVYRDVREFEPGFPLQYWFWNELVAEAAGDYVVTFYVNDVPEHSITVIVR